MKTLETMFYMIISAIISPILLRSGLDFEEIALAQILFISVTTWMNVAKDYRNRWK